MQFALACFNHLSMRHLAGSCFQVYPMGGLCLCQAVMILWEQSIWLAVAHATGFEASSLIQQAQRQKQRRAESKARVTTTPRRATTTTATPTTITTTPRTTSQTRQPSSQQATATETTAHMLESINFVHVFSAG